MAWTMEGKGYVLKRLADGDGLIPIIAKLRANISIELNQSTTRLRTENMTNQAKHNELLVDHFFHS